MNRAKFALPKVPRQTASKTSNFGRRKTKTKLKRTDLKISKPFSTELVFDN